MTQILSHSPCPKLADAASLTANSQARTNRAPRNDRDGGNASPLLVLVGKTRFAYTLGAGNLQLLPFLSLYNFGFGNLEEGLHSLFKVLSGLPPFDVFRFHGYPTFGIFFVRS